MPRQRGVRAAVDWLQNQLLRSITDTLDRHDATLREHTTRLRTMEVRMGAVTDALRSFRAQVDAESTRIGERIAALTARLDAGENVTAAEINTELSGVVDTLRAMGTGTATDPLPDPETPGDGGTVPADA
jgi:hypothetical protein